MFHGGIKMIITWLGHSCFLIENNSGVKILMDPYDSTLGNSPYKGSVDIVTISHNHFDHNYTKDLNPGFILLNTTGSFQSKDILIQGFPSYHDNINGLKRGDNIIFTYEIDNFKLCHLGDLGHILESEVIDLIGPIDILFIPISSNFTINEDTAHSLCKKLQSKIIIPMHYKISYLNYPGEGIEKFIALMKNATNLHSNIFEFSELSSIKNQVVIMEL